MDKVIEKANQKITSKNLDHLGLVAGMCEELKIAALIDDVMPIPLGKKISYGKLVVAMILNGLGFTNKALYLFPKYFEDKPIERLLGPGIKSEDINDDALGRALDAIHEFNPTELYARLSVNTVNILGLTPKSGHLDSTSIHVDGKYNAATPPEDGSKQIHITKGYSRDHRPELNQLVLNMIVDSQASIPLFMQTASGNEVDKSSFPKIIHKFISGIKNYSGIDYVIADSAMYSKKGLEALNDTHLFITRVPESLSSAKKEIEQVEGKCFVKINDNYSYIERGSCYGNVELRWFIIKSRDAKSRETKTVNKNFVKNSENEHKCFLKLCRQKFDTRIEAIQSLDDFINTAKCIEIQEAEIVENKKYPKPGKPGKDEIPRLAFTLTGLVCSSIKKYQSILSKKGYFIIATNELDTTKLSAEQALTEYKGQGKVERGFRFLKSPYFFASSVYLKKIERVMSLMMIMTLSLMVYAAIEFRMRQALL